MSTTGPHGVQVVGQPGRRLLRDGLLVAGEHRHPDRRTGRFPRRPPGRSAPATGPALASMAGRVWVVGVWGTAAARIRTLSLRTRPVGGPFSPLKVSIRDRRRRSFISRHVIARNTSGEPRKHTHRAFSGRPGPGRRFVPGIGGPGLKRSDGVTCLHRKISRYIVYQDHTQTRPLPHRTPAIAIRMVRRSVTHCLPGSIQIGHSIHGSRSYGRSPSTPGSAGHRRCHIRISPLPRKVPSSSLCAGENAPTPSRQHCPRT